MLSKEVLSEVLDLMLEKIEKLEFVDRYIDIYFTDGSRFSLNIYELAFKCKEYMQTRGYELVYRNQKCLIYRAGRIIKTINNEEITSYFEAINYLYSEGII